MNTLCRVNITRTIATWLLLALLPVAVLGQGSEPYPEGVVRVKLQDGSAVIGTVGSQNDSTVVLIEENGVRRTIPTRLIESVRGVDGEKFYRNDPNSSRLFFSATGRPIPAGAGYVSVYEIFFPFVAVGVADRISIAGGISIIPSDGGQIAYVAPKVSVLASPTFNLAVGALAGAEVFTGSEDDETVAFVYTVATFGGSEKSLTAGAGMGFGSSWDDPASERLGLMLGGDIQVTNSLKLITENHVFPGVEGASLFSGGVRFFGDRIAVDFAIVTAPAAWDEDDFPFLPWVSFAYNFGT